MNLESRALAFGAVLFIGMLLTIEMCRRLGRRQRAKLTEGGSTGIGAVNAAVFALLGLIIAFTFQGEIWKRAIASEKESSQKIINGLLPMLNAMFDIVTTRTMAAKMHPPTIIFALLALLALAAALLAGHGMSGSKVRSWIHIVGFAAVISSTVYVIIDMEHPRLGMIRVDNFDQVLVELRQSMK